MGFQRGYTCKNFDIRKPKIFQHMSHLPLSGRQEMTRGSSEAVHFSQASTVFGSHFGLLRTIYGGGECQLPDEVLRRQGMQYTCPEEWYNGPLRRFLNQRFCDDSAALWLLLRIFAFNKWTIYITWIYIIQPQTDSHHLWDFRMFFSPSFLGSFWNKVFEKNLVWMNQAFLEEYFDILAFWEHIYSLVRPP